MFSIAISLPKFLGRWIAADRLLDAGEVIEFDGVWSIARVRELQTEHLGILLRLLESIRGGLVFRLCFNNCQREISPISQQIIDALRWPANKALPTGTSGRQ